MHDTSAAAAIARAEQATRSTPSDPAVWFALATQYRNAGRADEEGRVWDAALAHLPLDASLMQAAGVSDLRRGNHEQAGERLIRAAELDPTATAPWLALARDAEGRGDLPRALACFAEAARRDVTHAADLVRIGRSMQGKGMAEAASEAFRRASDAARASLDYWRDLAAKLEAAGRLAAAGAALERALALFPNLAQLHGQAGDVLRKGGRLDAALRAYFNAVRLARNSPLFLNKLGCAQKELGDRRSAEQTFQSALALDRAFGLARQNLVTLYGESGELEKARELLREGLTIYAADDALRSEQALLLGVHDEHETLAPVIAEAVARNSDAPIVEKLAQVGDAALPYDGVLLPALWDLARKTHEGGGRDHRFALRAGRWESWPAFESHFSLHLGDDPAKVVQTMKGLAGGARAYADRPLLAVASRYADAVRLRQALPLPGPRGCEQEARLRFWHALLTQDMPALHPGQVKLAPNFVETNPGTPRTPPVSVAGTWRRMFTGPLLRAPAGPWRAALLYFAIAEIHGFADGNGRVSRLLINLELENCGYRPIVFSGSISETIARTLASVRAMGDLEPLVDLFARASASTTALLRAVGVRDPEPH